MSRAVFCTVPHYGGFFSVYRRLRASAAPLGWDVLSLEIGEERATWNTYDPGLAGPEHVALQAPGSELESAARTFVEWVRETKVDVVVPMSSPAALAALPHLPSDVAVVTRCGNVTPNAYRLVTTCPARTDRVVVTSPRQRDDLVKSYRVRQGIVRHIPNAVDTTRFHRMMPENNIGSLRIVVLDRLDQRQKRILMLPRILAMLDSKGVSYSVRIIGNGPDGERLNRELKTWAESGQVVFAGSVSPDEIPDLLSEADVLLKTSRNEGFPSSLIEAMAAGLVPVVSHLSGVTDWIVRHGETGLLCPVDDTEAFAAALAQLGRQPQRRQAMGHAARCDVAARFDLSGFGRAWAAVFEEATTDGLVHRPVRPWSDFREPATMRRPLMNRLLWRWLPRDLKDDARAFLEKARSSRAKFVARH